MQRAIVLLLLLVLGVAPSVADEKKAAGKPKPSTAEQAAETVLEAVKAKDDAALKALAEKDKPDPWRVADLLCYRGEHDAAAAFSKAAPRVDTERLPAYVEAWRKREPDTKERELIAAMNAALRARQFQRVIEGTATREPTMDTVIRIRLGHVRGAALQWSARLEESAAVLYGAGDAALALGWLARASRLYSEAGANAFRGSAYPLSLASWEQKRALAKRRGDKVGAASAFSGIGNGHEMLGNYPEALAAYGQALSEYKALGDRQRVADIIHNLGNVHRLLGDYATALSMYEQAMAEEQALGDERGAADTLGNIGLVHAALGEYAKALSIYRRALAQKQALGDRQSAAGTLCNIGNVHSRLGDYAKALSNYEQALAEQQALGDRRGATDTLGNIGSVYRSLGDYGKALRTLRQALAQKQALGDKHGAAGTLVNIGNVHHALGDYAKALSAREEALAQQQALGDKQGASRTLGNIGLLYSDLGDYAKALSLQEQAYAEMKALGDKNGAADTLGNIGIVHRRLGDYAKALSTYRQALEQQQALGDEVGAAHTLANIGNVHHGLGDYAKALSTFEQALARQRALGSRRNAAGTLNNIGNVYSRLGDYAKALSTYEQALAEQQALGDKQGVADTLHNMAIVYGRLGDHEKALATYEQALAQSEALGDKVGAATTLGTIAGVYRDLGDYAKALSTHEQALAQAEALGNKVGAAMTLNSIGSDYQRLGDDAKARAFYKKSARAAKSLRANPLLVSALTNLARLYLRQGEPSRALSAAQSALTALEGLLADLGQEQGATARGMHASLFATGALAAVREGEAAEALTFLESGRAGALLDALGKREALRWKAESLSPELRRLDLEANAEERAARLAYDLVVKHAGTLQERRAASGALDEATEAVRDVATRIQRDLKQQANLFYPRAKTIEDVEGALEAGQALVLYGLCLEEALALVLRPDGERVVSLGRVTDVTAACEALDATDPKFGSEAALETLRTLLVEPLKLKSDVKQILVSPEGPLCYLPFGALFDQTVAMTPSGTTHVLLREEERAQGKGILALGVPDYAGASEAAREIYYRGRTLTPLPATRKEVETIGTTQLLGAEASEAGFRDALSASKRWRAVHFACHGLVNIDKPMLSSLALSSEGADDGFLTALEILRTKIPADLAVLSACQTATGRIVKGEGIVGLTRAFMFAGTPRVICSLWKVDDEATQALMMKFYELWNPREGAGLPAATALQQAQAFIRGQEKWKHPYYWAAWVLWGLPN